MLIATEEAVYATEQAEPKTKPEVLLEPGRVQRIAAGRNTGIVALAEKDVLILRDGAPGEAAIAVPEPVESLLVLREEPLHLLIGTEGAHLFLLKEGRDSVERVSAFDELGCRERQAH